MAIQSVPRRDGSKQAATARRLIAQQYIAPCVMNASVELPFRPDEAPHVTHARTGAREVALVAGMEIPEQTTYFYVASPKFIGRYYVAFFSNGEWHCSSPEYRVRIRCVHMAEEYAAQQGIRYAQEVA